VDTDSSDADAGSAHEAWLRRSGYFREVFGYAEAVDLLNDSRLHANMVSTLEPLGVTSGPLWEVAAASLLSLNGTEHRRQRSLISQRFTPREAERARPVAREAAHNLVTSLEASGSCEFVAEFATPYISRSTCHFVGFAEEDVAARWHALELIRTATKDGRRFGAREQEVLLELATYEASVLEDRVQRPTGDVLTVVAQEFARGSITEPAALGFVNALLVAGHEPTIKQLGITVSVLVSRPDVWDALGAGELAPSAVVEAVLRYRSTNQGVLRRVDEPFEYCGVGFQEGEAVFISLAAANHDARHFAEPDHLDVEAVRIPHLAFGFGPHHCLGAALARVQLQEAISVLAQRLTRLEVRDIVDDEGLGLIGPSSLTMSFSSRGASPTTG
jgi:cytochrome P450